MTAEKYLNMLKRRKQRMEGMIEEKNKIMQKLTSAGGIDCSREHVQTSPSNDRICKGILDTVELDEWIEQERKKYYDEETDLIQMIRGLHNVNYIQVLFKVYVQFKPFKVIAKETKHSHAWVEKYHDEGVEAFEIYYKNFLNDWSFDCMENGEQIKELMNELYDVEQEKQKVLEKESELKAVLLQEMEKNQVDKLENVKIRVNYVNEFSKKMVDAKKLREEYPTAYRDCIRKSVVSPFVKVQVL